MSRVAAIGEEARVAGYAMAGVQVLTAEDASAACAAWDTLAGDVGCVPLTPSARTALDERVSERPDVIWVVMPGVDRH
jgi:vacuolar-type H+-ATPase subunit F/Vma7